MKSVLHKNRRLIASITFLLMAMIAPQTAFANSGDKHAATHTATMELEWGQSPFGPEVKPVSGDFSKGQHITFIKFKPGMITPVHTHSADYVGIVVTGNTMHWLPGKPETEKILPAGSHWSIPANAKHVSECLPGVECVMAIYQDKPFDFIPVQGAKLDDSAIIAIYNQVNGFDIQTGHLGVKNGHSEAVRELGKMVSHDHTSVRKAASDLAKEIGVRPVLPVGRSVAAQDQAAAIASLENKSGTDFDRAYLLHEIDFHTNAINAVKEVLLPNIANPKLKKLVLDILPGFEKHLDHTKKVAKKLGYI